jgi:hypothetical protein
MIHIIYLTIIVWLALALFYVIVLYRDADKLADEWISAYSTLDQHYNPEP